MGKYFTVEVKPTIAASIQNGGAYSANDVLFNWTEFDIPKGAARLIGVQMVVQGRDGGNGSDNDNGTDLFFAKSLNGVAPGDIGTVHATAGGGSYRNHLIGAVPFIAGSYHGVTALDTICGVAAAGGGSGNDQYPNMVLQGEPDSGTNVGFDKLYVSAITASSTNFASTMTVDGTPATTQANLDVADVDATIAFSPGDILHDEDDRLLGTIKTVTDATNILMEDNLANAGVNDKKVYNIHPIKLVLSFEK